MRHRRRRSRRPCSSSMAVIDCSRSIAIRRAGHRPSSWPTRRCCPSGSGSPGWVDDAREDLLDPTAAGVRHARMGELRVRASFLYRGGRLELAESWATELRLRAHRRRAPIPGDESCQGRSGPGVRTSAVASSSACSPRRSWWRSWASVSPSCNGAALTHVRRQSPRARSGPRAAADNATQAAGAPMSPAPSPRPGASARKHSSRTTTTRRCSSPWKDDTSKTRRRRGEAARTIQRSPEPLPSSAARPKPSSTSLTPDGTTLLASGERPPA